MESISEFMYFDLEYLYNFTIVAILVVDNINIVYSNEELSNIIDTIKSKINE